MKIHQISYYDHSSGWRLEPVTFSDLNLLVGVSGVGKTKILDSIIVLQKIANGISLNGIEWKILFTLNDVKYQWLGQFENTKSSDIFENQNENIDEGNYQCRVIDERLLINDKIILERKNNKIELPGFALPELSPFQSVVHLLYLKDIVLIKNEFAKIRYSEQSRHSMSTPIFSLPATTLNHIQEMSLPIEMKLALVYNYFPEVFKKIKEAFTNIFIQVEDLKFETENNLGNELLFIYMKEKGVDTWIKQTKMSSGMFKTLMHISELYLSAEGSVILIDEFENSLGVNCIDILAEDLLVNRDLQFIITSHHPYIINKIGMEHWKIVTRRGGVVTVKDAKDFNLGNSRHESFMQLINLDAYQEGIAVE